MIKILVNVDCLIPPLTGVGRYAQGILRELVQHPEVADVVAFSTFGMYSRVELAAMLASDAGLGKDISTASNNNVGPQSGSLKRVLMALFHRFKPWIRRIPGIRRVREWIRTRRVRNQYEGLEGYVYWEPNYLLINVDNPAVAVIHDVSHERMPQYHPQDRLTEMAARLPDTLRRAQRLIGVSQFTCAEIQALYAPTQPVDVVNPAVDQAFFEVTDADRARVRSKFNLPAHYLVSVATLEPRKNLLGLIEAYAQLPEALQQQFPLLLMGAKGWLAGQTATLMDAMQAKGVLRYLGYVDQADVPALVAQADVSVYVSFYEGFGMPIAEAMAAGTAVLTSNVTSMPEVAQGAALLVDPNNTESIAQGLLQLLQDEALRTRLGDQGRQVAAQYTWARSTQALLRSLKAAAGQGAQA